MAVVISLNRFMAPADDTVTAQHKSQVTSHKSQGGDAEGLILELATISVDSAEGSNWWNSTDIGATVEMHLKDGFGTMTPREGDTMS